jgi:hypothetical protein
MEIVCGKQTFVADAAALAEQLDGYADTLIDIGTGDGRFVLHAARVRPTLLAIGVDACRENLRATSRNAPRNALFAIADARALPPELRGLANRIAINFPWGSLLGALLAGDTGLLSGLAAIARPGEALEIRLNGGALAAAGWSFAAGGERVRQVLSGSGFVVQRAVELDVRALRACPTTWARRLAFGRDPRALYLRAEISAQSASPALAGPGSVCRAVLLE